MRSGMTSDNVSDRAATGGEDAHRLPVFAILMAASAVVLDGLDNQMLGLAAPTLIREWGISRQALGNVFALGFVGMAVGTLAAGWLGDRHGRKMTLLIGVVVFGLATMATGFAADIQQVAILRVVAGIGLGGVPGTAAALISELAPPRYRSIAVTGGVVCVSLGGMLGSIAAAFLLPALGWRWLFYFGGSIPLATAAFLYAFLPESPGFIAVRAERARQPRAPQGGQYDAVDDRAPTSALFRGALRRDTIAVSCALLTGMFMVYLMFNWAPTMLSSLGFDTAESNWGATAFNLGGIVGALITALAMAKLGSRVLPILALVGSAICFGLAIFPVEGLRNITLVLLSIFALGLSACAVQSAIFALAAHVFPIALRARGIGFMGAGGRIGAICSALGGAALISGGPPWFFGSLGVLMLINATSLFVVRQHIPKSPGRKRGHARIELKPSV
jgi:AAHS family 4-hydroxybenzoate transporter-like MFS transporter